MAVPPAPLPPAAEIGIAGDRGRGGGRGRGRGRGNGRGAAVAAAPSGPVAAPTPKVIYSFTKDVLLKAIREERPNALEAVKGDPRFNLNLNLSGNGTPFFNLFQSKYPVPVLDWLLKHGAKVNVKVGDKATLYSFLVYQDHLAKYEPIWKALKDEGVDPNQARREGAPPLFSAISVRAIPFIRRIAAAGADLTGERVQYLNMTPILYAILSNLYSVADVLIELGVDIKRDDPKGGNTLLQLIQYYYIKTYIELENIKHHIEYLVKKGIDINSKSGPDEQTALTFITMLGAEENIKTIVEALLNLGADPNVKPRYGPTAPIYCVRRILKNERMAKKDTLIKVLKELLTSDIPYTDIKLGYGEGDGKTLVELAQDESEALNAEARKVILDALAPKNAAAAAGPLWEGWTRADAQQFDGVLDVKKGEKFAVCPICLKYVEYIEGCMYMHHSCPDLGGFYHKGLYKIFKHAEADGLEGEVEWCLHCGRAAYNHAHIDMKFPDGTPTTMEEILRRKEIPPLWKMGDPYARTCTQEGIHGGGFPEKIGRIRALREAALAAQEKVGVATELEVQNSLVSANWNAPLVSGEGRVKSDAALKGIVERREKREAEAKAAGAAKTAEAKKAAEAVRDRNIWNIPATAFPVKLERRGEGNEAAADVKRPAADAQLNPTVEDGHSLYNLNDPETDPARPVIRFEHRIYTKGGGNNENAGALVRGEIHRHGNDELIGIPSFVERLQTVLAGEFSTPEFGYCWNYPHCKGVIWPEELAALRELVPEELPAKLVEDYSKKFNRKFQGKFTQGGGARGGGMSIFVDVTDQSSCSLPQKGVPGSGTRRRGGGRRVRRTRRVRRER